MKEVKSGLKFNTTVLGDQAARRLREQLVTQTLRSSELPALSQVVVYLDNIRQGLVTIQAVNRIKWSDLTLEDAHRGGFDGMTELRRALLRAGFRFKPLDDYSFYRTRFQWM